MSVQAAAFVDAVRSQALADAALLNDVRRHLAPIFRCAPATASSRSSLANATLLQRYSRLLKVIIHTGLSRLTDELAGKAQPQVKRVQPHAQRMHRMHLLEIVRQCLRALEHLGDPHCESASQASYWQRWVRFVLHCSAGGPPCALLRLRESDLELATRLLLRTLRSSKAERSQRSTECENHDGNTSARRRTSTATTTITTTTSIACSPVSSSLDEAQARKLAHSLSMALLSRDHPTSNSSIRSSGDEQEPEQEQEQGYASERRIDVHALNLLRAAHSTAECWQLVLSLSASFGSSSANSSSLSSSSPSSAASAAATHRRLTLFQGVFREWLRELPASLENDVRSSSGALVAPLCEAFSQYVTLCTQTRQAELTGRLLYKAMKLCGAQKSGLGFFCKGFFRLSLAEHYLSSSALGGRWLLSGSGWLRGCVFVAGGGCWEVAGSVRLREWGWEFFFFFLHPHLLSAPLS
jgi:hypothetical protein